MVNLTTGINHATDIVLYHRYKQPESECCVLWVTTHTAHHLGLSHIDAPVYLITFSFSVPVTNPCDRKKCEWLCLLSPSGPVCTCPNNYVADNGTCLERPPPTQSPFCESADTCVRIKLAEQERNKLIPYKLSTPTPHTQRHPLGPVIFSVRMAGAASSMPVMWPSVAASLATLVRDARSTSAETTATMEARVLHLIQVSWFTFPLLQFFSLSHIRRCITRSVCSMCL